MISLIISIVFRIIYLIIILTCLLSFIQVFNPTKEPIASILRTYDKIMKPFRGIIPPIAGRLDITPLIVFILLQVLENVLYSILRPLGL